MGGTPRIGIDARLRAYRGGGIAEHVSRLLDGLTERCPREQLVVLDHRKAPSLPAHPFETRRLWTPPHHRLEGLALPVELIPTRLDLLHCPDVVLPAAWRGAAVVTVHDLAFMRRPELLTTDSRRYYMGVLDSVRRAHRTIAVSEHTRRELIELTDVDAARVRVVPNPIHPRYREASTRGEDASAVSELGLERPFVLFVSTIEPRKNIATLLEAFRILLDEGRDLDLVLAGAEGWLSAPVHAKAEALGLDERARFLGFVPDAALATLYRRASLLAHPAIDEGFGFTPAEAMASGTPVVVSEAGSLPELVGDAGLRVQAEDVEAWATAIAEVLDSPSLAERMSVEGKRRVSSLTPLRMAESTLAVYREALDLHAGRAA